MPEMATFPFYGQRNRGSEKIRNLPEGTQVRRGRGRCRHRLSGLSNPCSCHIPQDIHEQGRELAADCFLGVWESGLSTWWGCFNFGFGCGFASLPGSPATGMVANRWLKGVCSSLCLCKDRSCHNALFSRYNLRYNLHITLCKFEVYNVVILYMYILQNDSTIMLVNTSVPFHSYSFCVCGKNF